MVVSKGAYTAASGVDERSHEGLAWAGEVVQRRAWGLWGVALMSLCLWGCSEEGSEALDQSQDNADSTEEQTPLPDQEDEWACKLPDTSAWPEVCIPATSMGSSYTATSEDGIEVELAFDQHFLLSVNGQACTYCEYFIEHPGDFVASSFYNCDVYYQCGDPTVGCRYHVAILASKPPRWILFGPSENMVNSDACRPYTAQSWHLADAVGAPGWCAPTCSKWGRACGPDGCGGTCGSCDDGDLCVEGVCKDPSAPTCPAACLSPSGRTCCEPPFCSGDCVGSPCC